MSANINICHSVTDVTFAPTYVDGDMCWSESTYVAADLSEGCSVYCLPGRLW